MLEKDTQNIVDGKKNQPIQGDRNQKLFFEYNKFKYYF